jgi:murein DD-endopeptidase MepM/ murein hydrolase activator NlpD
MNRSIILIVLMVTGFVMSCRLITVSNAEPSQPPVPTMSLLVVQLGEADKDPATVRPPYPGEYCWKSTGSIQEPAQPPTPFLYLPFDGVLTEETWSSQMDHDQPNYRQNGVIAALGEIMRYDTHRPGLAGGTEVYQTSGRRWFGYDVPYSTLLEQGYHILAYQSASLETYQYYDGHDGHDFAVVGKALAAGNGVVAFRGDYGNSLGRVIEIYHSQGYLTRYAHLASFENGLEVGTPITAGQPIGDIGGLAVVDGVLKDNHWGIHLHFSVFRWDGGEWQIVDPFGWDPWAGPDVESHYLRQQEDPLITCNGEISYSLWVDGWPRLYDKSAATAPFAPTADRYVGGWLGDVGD